MISEKKIGNYPVMIETYTSAGEMVNDLRKRPITDSCFQDKSKKKFSEWEGVKTYDECLDYMKNGYQPTVDALKYSVKPKANGCIKRMGFKNDIVGGNPIVPLAMMGVPNCMQNTYIRQIKAKVIDLYYDLTCSASVKSEDIIDTGQKLLSTILRLEQQGYKFNLYAVQSYYNSSSCDMLAIKIKASNQPLDLKRMSYTLTHTSFFRVLGFDWYSRTPKGKYRFAYGSSLCFKFDCDGKKLDEFTKKIFGDNSIYLSAMIMIRKFKNNKYEYINNMINVK